MGREILSRGNTALRVKVYSKNVLGINTYSLRYARITHMLRNDVSPSIAAKIIGQKNLDHANIYADKNGRRRAQGYKMIRLLIHGTWMALSKWLGCDLIDMVAHNSRSYRNYVLY